MQTLIPLIPFLPLIGFAVNGLFGGRMPKSVSGWIGSGSVLLSFLLSVMAFMEVSATHAPIRSEVYPFMSVGSLHIGFGFLVDALSAWMMLIVTGIGFLIHVYSMGYMHDDDGFSRFFAYLNLFIFSMLLLVMGDNFLMLFFGWEGVGLCSYLLIGFWYTNRDYNLAANKAFIMNRIGDLGLLLGMFLIFHTFGSLQYETVFKHLAENPVETGVITSICLLLFIGAIGKSAQIPLYTWLPDAMAGPTPVSALIHAATMVTAGIYLVARCNGLFSLSHEALQVVAVVGMATSVLAALIGLRQNDIKKVLAYSTVSQLGLMFVALGMGAYASAMFHVTTHAFFKALLFLGAGSVIHAMGGEQDIRNMGGLRKHLPVTFWVFLAGTLAISGVPVLSGFFSKDEILAHTFDHGGPIWWALASFSSLLTAVYMGRLLFLTFYGSFRGTHEQAHHLHESPATMTIPLIILAILSIAGGLLNLPHFMHLEPSQWLAHWLAGSDANGQAVVPMTEVHILPSTEWMLMGVASVVAIVALAYTYMVYTKPQNVPAPDEQLSGWGKILAGKFYVDELYDTLFVRPTEAFSKTLHYYVDVWAIDGVVEGVGKGFQTLGATFRRLQNGNIEYYLIGMVAGGIGLLLTYFL
ncbi:MAG: NADH-quinone oxidoreductase subunit L [Saprospiraceae bacterium]|nr:NADH-quinone oxidoreductase subunit L [Saprospiraceae bacterium]